MAILLALPSMHSAMRAEEIRRELQRLGIRASKGLGQHFLIDERIAHRQVEFASIQPNEIVFEVGPGLGILTRLLANRARHVIAIEKDRRLAEALVSIGDNLEILRGDALEIPWPRFDVMVSNLPYNISSPVVFRLLDHPADRAVLMFQREFADRMVAKVGTKAYSRLTVGVYHRAECDLIARVPRSAFHPVPEVDSAIVRLVRRAPPYRVRDDPTFHRVVDACFGHRRKTIANALDLAWPQFALDRKAWRAQLRELPFGERRGETLTPEEFAKLANEIVRAKG